MIVRDVYYLERTQDGAGALGELSIAILSGPEGVEYCVRDARPQVGIILFVGSRSGYEGAIRWRGRRTSPITMILSNTPGCVVFETVSGSRYVWQCARDPRAN